ncbi:MAG: hypothetical protein JRL30_27530 [Deltaproteobacteria bacterium]|nr:hypothetical protein [Deltaproteobacteria bacterium]
MDKEVDLKAINDKIQLIKRETEALKEMGSLFPALARNSSRILASIKMLELNISDIADL